MAWVSVHDNVIGGKLRELAKEMGCTQEEALGILVSLWIWSLNNADKDGKLMSVDREDVLEAFSMKLVSGLKVDLVDTLVKTRWMDEPEPGVLYIHDWDQWQEQWYKAMERREKDAKRKAERRRAGAARKPAPVRKPAVPPEPAGGVEPSDGEGTLEKPKELTYTTAFEEFWAAYPRKRERGSVQKVPDPPEGWLLRRRAPGGGEELRLGLRQKEDREGVHQAPEDLLERQPPVHGLLAKEKARGAAGAHRQRKPV